MPFSLCLLEPKTSDYLYIDENNHVHLLLPVVSGDTIGLDNTCKTTLELQTFFHGRPREHKKSALDVLTTYQNALMDDISLLKKLGGAPEVVASKQHRLSQIQAYIGLLDYVKNEFISANANYPSIPPGAQVFLKRQTNCLSIRLSPQIIDRAIRMEAPIFSLARTSANDYEAPPDNYLGLGPELRSQLLDTLLQPRARIQTPREQILADVNAEFRRMPPIRELQQFMKVRISKRFSQKVDLIQGPDGVIDEEYLESLLGTTIAKSSPHDVADFILHSALSDTFWEKLKRGFFIPQNTIALEDEAERLAIAVQFFLAEINVYCHGHNLSQRNFGLLFDKSPYRTQIATLVKEAIVSNESVEKKLLSYVNTLTQSSKLLSRKLSNKDKQQIMDTFTTHYTTVKSALHFDEFMVFDPEVPGDFFNHKNRISLHFLDFLEASILSLEKRQTINRTITTHRLSVYELKTRSKRRLEANNAVATLSFLDFLPCSASAYCGPRLAMLCKEILPSLTFDELTFLVKHPQWAEAEEAIYNHPNIEEREQYINALQRAKNRIRIFYNKTVCTQGKKLQSELFLNDAHWIEAGDKLEKIIREYKDRFRFRFKSNVRKQQVKQLEIVLQGIRALNEPEKQEENRISAISCAIQTFATIRKTIADETHSDSVSSLQQKIGQIIDLFLELFQLKKSPLGTNPLAPIEEVRNYENTCLQELPSCALFHELNSHWWEVETFEKIKTILAANITPALITWLNSIDPKALDENALETLQKEPLDFTHPIDLETLRSRGRYLLNPPPSPAAPTHRALYEEIEKTKQHYTQHVRNQWSFGGLIKRAGFYKNKIIQQELSRAEEYLETITPNALHQVQSIIEALKSVISQDYGNTSWSWSWFAIKRTTSESIRVLNQLLHIIETAQTESERTMQAGMGQPRMVASF